MRTAEGAVCRVDYCGVLAGGDALLARLAAEPDPAFSVMTTLLAMAATPGAVAVCGGPPGAPFAFLDMGTPDELARAEAAVRAGAFA